MSLISSFTITHNTAPPTHPRMDYGLVENIGAICLTESKLSWDTPQQSFLLELNYMVWGGEMLQVSAIIWHQIQCSSASPNCRSVELTQFSTLWKL